MKQFLLFAACLYLISCRDEQPSIAPEAPGVAREHMRDLVAEISYYGRGIHPGFIVIPQNGQELYTISGEPDGEIHQAYHDAIDGQGREELFFGYDNQDDQPTPNEGTEAWIGMLRRQRDEGLRILVTDYCEQSAHVDESISLNETEEFIAFQADERELVSIPSYPSPLHGENADVIADLSAAQNFLYLINPETFPGKSAFIDAVTATNYDVLIMDAFFEDESWTASELNQLRTKANGGSRLIIAYMSIGEAEDYRFYWQQSWYTHAPDWLYGTNPDWVGNYQVRYWDPEWKDILIYRPDSYLRRILSSGFDGVYLDIIDAYEAFE